MLDNEQKNGTVDECSGDEKRIVIFWNVTRRNNLEIVRVVIEVKIDG